MLLRQFSDGIYYEGECKNCGFAFTVKFIDFDCIDTEVNRINITNHSSIKINKDATFDCPFCKSKIKEVSNENIGS